jgi:DNA-binding IclR family transcriptional regulator
MPAERVAMRVVREVLRLTFAGVSKREVARRTGMAASTVRAAIARFESLGLVWPLPETITDSDLEAKIHKNAGKKQGHRRIIEPDWASLHREMKRKHVTLSILWDEYRGSPGGMSLQPLLRALPVLGRQALRHDAPSPFGWR